MTWNFHRNLPVLRVVAEDVAGHVLDARLVVALLGGVADDEHVVDDDRRRRGRDVAERERQALGRIVVLLRVDPRPPVGDQILQHVDRAGLREAAHRHRAAQAFERLAGLGIERVQEEARRRDEDHAAAVDARVGDALAVVRCASSTRGAASRAPGTSRASCRSPDRARPPCGAGRGREQHAVDVDRQRARVDVAELDARRHLAAPFPRHLQRVEVRRVDLIERRVAGGRVAAGDAWPFAVLLGAAGQAGDHESERRARLHREPRDFRDLVVIGACASVI